MPRGKVETLLAVSDEAILAVQMDLALDTSQDAQDWWCWVTIYDARYSNFYNGQTGVRAYYSGTEEPETDSKWNCTQIGRNFVRLDSPDLSYDANQMAE